MFVEHAGADLWIAPPNTQLLQPGEKLGEQLLMRARTTPGVEAAEPLMFTAGTVKKPNGGAEPVTLIGTQLPVLLGGPWNLVSGDRAHSPNRTR